LFGDSRNLRFCALISVGALFFIKKDATKNRGHRTMATDRGNARKNKQDEFYTKLIDIENECKHYKEQFNGKTIFCNCDDPYESNFFKYFAMNFNHLGLKKLICTCYRLSPVALKTEI